MRRLGFIIITVNGKKNEEGAVKKRQMAFFSLLLPHLLENFLTLLKCTLNLPELQCISVADGRGHIGVQAFAVDAREVRAVQVGQLVGTADVLKGRVAARDSIGAVHGAKIDFGLHAAQVMIVASD